MPTYRITAPDGKSYDVTAPEGASEQDVLAYAQRSFKMAAAPKAEKPSKPFGQQLNEAIADTPRQLGLTARYGLEGVGDVLDFVASPIRAGLNALGANVKGRSGETLANIAGLPQPKTAQERIVADASRLVAGGALPIAAGARLAQAPGVAGSVGAQLAANPAMQLGSAAAAGGAGGYTRETGGNEGSQLAASLAAGIAAPMVAGGAQRAINAARQAVARPAVAPQQIDITINNALRDSGVKLGDLPAEVAGSIRNDVSQALQTGGNLSDDAVRRLADYRLTGLTPTRASLTLNPSDVTRQKNLAKLGANSADPAAQQLAEVQNLNNKALTQGLNDLGAANAADPVAGAQRIMGALSARNDRAKSIINNAYANARDTQGRVAMLDPSAFTRKANDLLDDALLGGKLPADVRNLLNRTATGEMPLTVDVAEQFKTRIGELQRSTTDLAERKALGLVRNALDDAPLQPGQQIGQESINAFNKARALNRSWMNIVDRTPALQAVRDGIEPDKFVQQFIVGGGSKSNIMDVAQLKNSIKANPEAMQAMKEQITSYLKSKALGGAADEVGNFSQSAYNNALKALGERKLNLFFSPQEVNQLKAIGRVASYEQVQPVGAAVNNSNTASAVGGLLERIAGSAALGKLPLGRAAIGDPLQNILISRQAGAALNAPQALIGAPQIGMPQQRAPLALSPAALVGLESPEERQRREQGLLLP
jgi:hypothetical protein